MNHRLLIFNAGDGDIPLIHAAHALGYYVIASGRDTTLPGYQFADKTIACDYSNKDEMLWLTKEEKADAILANCNDAGIKSASYVAQEMGFAGFDPYETTCILHDKDTMKRLIKEMGLPSPLSVDFSDTASAAEWTKSAVEYPYICKPVDLSAGRGMTVVRKFEDFQPAIVIANESARSGRFVIEPFIEGIAQSHSCFIIDEKVAAYYMTNEYVSRNNPYCIDGCCSPATDMDTVAPIINEAVEKLAHRLHLKNGLIHTQHILKNGTPYILEITRRHPGALYSLCASLGTGIPYSEWYVRFQLGDDGKNFPQFHGQSGYRGRFILMADKNAVVTDVTIDNELKKYVFDEIHFWKPELEVRHYNVDIIGILFLEYPSFDEFERLRPHMHEMVHISYKE